MRFLKSFFVVLTMLEMLLPALGVRADELTGGFGGQIGYDSNVFNSEKNEEDDFFLRVTPWVTLRRQNSGLTYDLTYRPYYEHYDKYNQIDNWTHRVIGSLGYQLTPATKLSLSDTFWTSDATRGGYNPDTGDIGNQAAVRRDVNTFSLGVQHSFSARTNGNLNISQSFTKYDTSGQRDADSFAVGGSLSRVLTKKSAVGVQARFSQQNFGSVENVKATSTRYYNLSGTFNHTFDPTWTLSLVAGPALVDPDSQQDATTVIGDLFPSDQFPSDTSLVSPIVFGSCDTGRGLNPLTERLARGCSNVGIFATPAQWEAGVSLPPPLSSYPPLPIRDPVTVNLPAGSGSTGDSTWSFFANLTLQKTWERSNLSFTLSRQETSASDTNQQTSTINDRAQVNYVVSLSRRWNLSLNGTWSQYTSAGKANVPVEIYNVDSSGFAVRSGSVQLIKTDSATDYTNLSANIALGYRLSRHMQLTGNVSYFNQTNNSDFDQNRGDYDVYRVLLGLRYTFDSIHF